MNLKALERHNYPQHFSAIYKDICTAQGSESFLVDCRVKNAVKNSLNYLVISNNLLLSLVGAPSLTPSKNILSFIRAREQRHNIDRQSTSRSFLCPDIHVRLQRFII